MDSNPKGIEGENFVNDIANNIFLEYWCYPSPKDEKGDKKEICDLLILFQDILIIISVKNYDFKGNYDRYFKNTIDKALKQIQGAERRLFNTKEIYFKHPKKEIELFQKNKYSKIFRIIVNLGEGLKFYHPSVYTKSNHHVTIMNRGTWFSIVNEMNTIVDLTNYLTERESLLKQKDVIMLTCTDNELDEKTYLKVNEHLDKVIRQNKKQVYISGNELDLLASYIKNSNSYSNELKSDEFQGIFFDLNNTWESFVSTPEYLLKKQNDKDSFFIDNFVIEEIGYRKELKVLAEKLMSLSRFKRRIISKHFFDFYKKYKNISNNHLARVFANVSEFGFVFVKYPEKLKGEQLDNALLLAVDSFAVHTNYLTKEYILIAYYDDFKGLKYNYFEFLNRFTQKEEEQIMIAAKSLGWFSDSFKYRDVNEKEY
ncbi:MULTISPECIES: hypothetical protein [Tenacibaculum]|uniref:hypothetical protein n=1 Tax=Tenacibaculum TaxID=104267 RepID=UPI00187B581B|nr:hypothetical protein [Tenacibaculum finnmarkense]MBE7646694.1 hypothetical protein [Tenacibaculum finnmarkense genomovar ulcerans]MCG8752631.1 hypothetical protein [Tenacibaculum finnmarkense]MCG8771104.1 hypothetical protein [Tenacibaculum finnmarkense]MCG8873198.1 hypothetical protein [Tenacibaculum finnmarkense]